MELEFNESAFEAVRILPALLEQIGLQLGIPDCRVKLVSFKDILARDDDGARERQFRFRATLTSKAAEETVSLVGTLNIIRDQPGTTWRYASIGGFLRPERGKGIYQFSCAKGPGDRYYILHIGTGADVKNSRASSVVIR